MAMRAIAYRVGLGLVLYPGGLNVLANHLLPRLGLKYINSTSPKHTPLRPPRYQRPYPFVSTG